MNEILSMVLYLKQYSQHDFLLDSVKHLAPKPKLEHEPPVDKANARS
jgi:hypothetical protein